MAAIDIVPENWFSCMISKFFIVISAFNSFLSIFTGFAHT